MEIGHVVFPACKYCAPNGIDLISLYIKAVLLCLSLNLSSTYQVNCYSLNSVGPTMENICGPQRFLAVYMTSAIASKLAIFLSDRSNFILQH